MAHQNLNFAPTRQSPHTTIHNEFQGTTDRIMPKVRGDYGYGYQNTPTNEFYQEKLLPMTKHISQPQPANVKTYETFETPSSITHPFYFAEQQHAEFSSQQNNQNKNCPNCVTGKANFKLQNDPTDSVFCSSCRQPYHICKVHGKSISGMGRNLRDPQIQECQCTRNQSFLNQENWNSCFNK